MGTVFHFNRLFVCFVVSVVIVEGVIVSVVIVEGLFLLS